MKKMFLFFLPITFFYIANAQPKVTKTNIIGKWRAAVFDFKEKMYYDIIKDSLYMPSDSLYTPTGYLENPMALVSRINMKDQIKSIYKDVYFVFDSNGFYEANDDVNKRTEKGSFDLSSNSNDEILTLKPDKKNDSINADTSPQTMKCYFKNGHLVLDILQGNQLLILELYKSN
jgi:hypothetical protein